MINIEKIWSCVLIKLTKDLYIAKGAERECYADPEDSSKLIKIQYNNAIDRNQNDLDVFYYNYLKDRDISYSHIPKYYQNVKTNRGEGVLFDAIKDYNGEYSKSFEDVVLQKTLSAEMETTLLDELQLYLLNNMIVFGDVVLSNILCQEFKENEYKLIIVDGLGARRFGFKLWLHTRSKLFTKFRIKKQWKKLIQNYQECKN